MSKTKSNGNQGKSIVKLMCHHCGRINYFYEHHMNEVGYYNVDLPTDGPDEVNVKTYCQECISHITSWFIHTAELPSRR